MGMTKAFYFIRNRKKYPRELEQYQKLAVLTALKAVESPRWTTCSRWMQASWEGRKWLKHSLKVKFIFPLK